MRGSRRAGALRATAGCALVAAGVVRAAVGCGGGAGDVPPLDGSLAEHASGDEGGPGPGPGPEPGAPGFCQGLVFYASLDTSFTPELGAMAPVPSGAAQLSTAGRFGGSALLDDDAGGEAGASVYYVEAKGAPVYPAQEGTVSVWYRGAAFDETASQLSPVLHRTVANAPTDPVVGAGLAVANAGGRFGIYDVPAEGGTQGLILFPVGVLRPFLRARDFNHFVTAWRRGDAGGAPTAMLVVNGGSGEVFDDASAPSYADASPDDAGNLSVPYRAYTTRAWTDDTPIGAFRLGGPSTSVPRGDIDDVAVWNRVLSLDEIAQIYAANAPIADVCRLR